jgi:hypothetical protein
MDASMDASMVGASKKSPGPETQNPLKSRRKADLKG